MAEQVVILSNTASQEEAERISERLVSEYLAACVNIIPRVHSVYRWEGKVQRAQEWMLVIKTRIDAVDQAIKRLVELHSYEVPEAIVLPIERGHRPYLDWISANVEGTWHELN